MELLYSLDGESSLGNSIQQIFKLFSEDGTLISDCGDLEAAAYEAFFENKDNLSNLFFAFGG